MTTTPIGTVRPDRSDLSGAPPAMHRAAQDFESVFIGQLLSGLTEGLGGGGLAGGGPLGGGEDDPFASMLRDEYGKMISRRGGIGIGIADAVLRELLRAQEGS
jgi:peptidoglycan hydrolase FlgJ